MSNLTPEERDGMLNQLSHAAAVLAVMKPTGAEEEKLREQIREAVRKLDFYNTNSSSGTADPS